MREVVLLGLSFCAMAAATPATASVFTDDLSRCLVNKTAAGDKTMPVRWIFASISVADEVRDMIKVTDAQRDDLSRQAALFTRLIVKDRKDTTTAAIKNDGPDALRRASACSAKSPRPG